MKDFDLTTNPILTAIYELEASQAGDFILEYLETLGKDGENRERYNQWMKLSSRATGKARDLARMDISELVSLAEHLRPEVIPKTKIWKEVLETRLTVN